MRWLVTGSAGMLGTDVVGLLRSREYDVTAAVRSTADLHDPGAVRELVEGHDLVVNCAAWTAVDDAETHEAEALEANGVVPDILARAVAGTTGRLVQISTDYVFEGHATTPYAEDARTAPRSAYGRTKAAGEEAVRAALPGRHHVVRTAWLYGAHGGCFPKTIARVAREKGAVSVVDDQVGQPTWTADVADLVVRLVEADAPAGTYHATSSGRCSWFDFARAVVAAAGLDPAVVTPTTSDAFVRPAPRPAYSVLGHGALERIGVAPIGGWRERWEAAAPSVLR
ncbi:MAG TPA: dTDP-4-dehydrorhamnose reductase [Nocardioides sp.]|uniref:dTDP-4-dehydrorhamnose reductase n=1 Tax=Nocardioides sp. TaxID=35761 RepID=UPI002D7E1879|nr:dTDP-4-dehydrorhamnose reductase [Nocardioides sp.]HET6653751.1 dTDP-4-dehydrorhamnose reductase [Nocardioides sp.]